MASYLKKLLRRTIKHHLNGDEIVKQMIEWCRDQIQKAVDAKQVLIEGFEDGMETEATRVSKELLMNEQVRNIDFIKTLTSAIDYLDHKIKEKRYELENPPEVDSEDDDEEENEEEDEDEEDDD